MDLYDKRSKQHTRTTSRFAACSHFTVEMNSIFSGLSLSLGSQSTVHVIARRVSLLEGSMKMIMSTPFDSPKHVHQVTTKHTPYACTPLVPLYTPENSNSQMVGGGEKGGRINQLLQVPFSGPDPETFNYKPRT